MSERKSLTAAELIVALGTLPGDTLISWSEWDSERDWTTVWGVSGVHRKGALLSGGILDSYDEM